MIDNNNRPAVLLETEGPKYFDENIEDILKLEINILSAYTNNEVYTFEIIDKKGNVIDSANGFYGDDGLKLINDEINKYKIIENKKKIIK
jgi:hypothetical protein